MEELCFCSAIEIAKLVRERRVSAVEVVEAFEARIERANPKLCAYVTLTGEKAREAAREIEGILARGGKVGPLVGVPFSVKDLVFTAGVRTTGGSLVYRDFVPAEDSCVVERLKGAGAILLGKTNTPEFGYKATTENLLFGETRNPWDLGKTPGGSSGGAGAAVAAGLSPLAVGTDGGGSIRIPASFCGIFGLKPTFGRVPNTPGFGGWRTLSHTGPMTRTVADAALMLDVIAGPDERDRTSLPADRTSFLQALQVFPQKLRLGWSSDLGYAEVDPSVREVVGEAVKAFAEVGWEVEEAQVDLADPVEIFNTLVRAENFAFAGPLLQKHASLLDPGMRKFTELGAAITTQAYLRAMQERDRLCGKLAAFFTRYDLLVTPTLAVLPFPIGSRPETINGKKMPHPLGWLPFTYPWNLTGNPAASLPCGWTEEGLPVGMQVVGKRFADALVLQVCAAFERLRPWTHRRPVS